MSGQYNLRNPAVKRLMKEAQELREPTEQYFAQPLEDNLFEWHFTIRGPVDSEFEGGIYHGRITLPPEYPMKPPSIMLLTPNGRFETFKKICLSISGHHPESWQPSWSIRTALLAIIGFMPTHGNGAIGSLDYTAEERKVLSKRSLEWKCSECGSMKTMLKPVTEASKKTTEEAKELASQINFQGEKEKKESSAEGGSKNPQPAGAESAAAAAPATTTATTSGAASGAGASPTTPVSTGAPPFNHPMFPPNFPTMPNAAMPSFMPRMMTPPGTGGAMPPFPRPFWPGMVPGNAAMPARPPGGMMYPWPPMFNPMMMNAQMMAMMNQQMRWPTPAAPIPASTPSSTSPPAATSPTSPPAAPTSPPAAATSPPAAATSPPAAATSPNPAASEAATSTSTVTSSQSSATRTSAATTATAPSSSPSAATPAAAASSPSTSSAPAASAAPVTPTSSPSSPSPAPSAPAAGSTAEAALRQRTAATVTRPPAPLTPAPTAPTHAPTPTYTPAQLPAQTVRRGENPVVVLVMALLGLLIIALILRRLYNVVNAAAFDNDF